MNKYESYKADCVQAVDRALLHQGFARKRLHWRRAGNGVIHQFSLEERSILEDLNPRWGVHVCRYAKSLTPQAHKLHLKWSVPAFMSMGLIDNRFIYALSPKDGERVDEDVVSSLIELLVLPTFANFPDEESVRGYFTGERRPYLLASRNPDEIPQEWQKPRG